MGADGWVSLLPVESQPTELPATTEGGGGDATSRQDTRQDRWLYFGFQLHWSFFSGVFQGLCDPTMGRAQNVESQAVWLLTRQSRLGVYTLFRRHRVTEPPAGKPGKLVG